MHLYFDPIDLPKKSELALFTSHVSPFHPYIDEWIDDIQMKGDIIIQVPCEDGIVCLVRLDQLDKYPKLPKYPQINTEDWD